MDALKKSRTAQCTLFTKGLNAFLLNYADPQVEEHDRRVSLQLLESRLSEMEIVNNKYVVLLLQSTANEQAIEEDLQSHEEYRRKFLEAKLKLPTSNHSIDEITHREAFQEAYTGNT